MKLSLVTLSLLFLPIVKAITLTAEVRTFSAATSKMVTDILKQLLSCYWSSTLQPLYEIIKSGTTTESSPPGLKLVEWVGFRLGTVSVTGRCLYRTVASPPPRLGGDNPWYYSPPSDYRKDSV